MISSKMYDKNVLFQIWWYRGCIHFHRQKHVIEIFTIDVNKFVVSDRVSCSYGKCWRYIVEYQLDGQTIILFSVKIPKIYLVMIYLNTTITELIQCPSMFLSFHSGCFTMEISQMRLSCSYLKSWQQNL